MRIVELSSESRDRLLEDLLKRSPNSYGEFEGRVAAILADVKERRMPLYSNIRRNLTVPISAPTIWLSQRRRSEKPMKRWTRLWWRSSVRRW